MKGETLSGKIYSNDEIIKLYGKRVNHSKLNRSLFESACENCGDRFCISLANDDSGVVLLVSKNSPKVSTPFTWFDNSVVREFLTKTKSDQTYIVELKQDPSSSETDHRQNVIVISGSNYSLQAGSWCPPDC